MVDGWIIDNGITGKPHLAFTYERGNLKYLGNANAIEFELNTLASQEIAIRILLENKGILSGETYEGNHVIIRFPLSTGEPAQLLLSQPVIQGEEGIWVVERWMDGNGNIYHDIPNIQEDLTIEEYYRDLQRRSENREDISGLNPVGTGYEYIISTLGQILVKPNDLEVVNEATIEEFLDW